MTPFQSESFCRRQAEHSTLRDSFESVATENRPWFVRCIALVSPDLPFQDDLSPGWSDGAMKLKEVMFGGQQDAFALKVHKVFCIPPWENKPCLKHVAFPRRHAKRSKQERWSEAWVGSENRSHKKALVYRILGWELQGVEASHDAVASLYVYRPLRQELGFQMLQDAVAAEPVPVENLKGLPVLCLPSPLAFAVSCGLCDQVPMLARWTHPFFPTLSEGLPQAWLNSLSELVLGAGSFVAEEKLLSYSAGEKLLAYLRKMGSQVLASVLDEDIASGIRAEVIEHLQALKNHLYALEVAKAPQVKNLACLKFPSDSFVQQILASLDLRNRAKLQQHATRFVQMLPEALKPYLQAWTSTKIASGTALHRGQLMLDVGLELFHRERLLDAGKVYKYAWGDSTDKWGLEIYNARYKWVKQSDCVHLARAFRFLCAHPFEEDMSVDVLEKRRECSTRLFQSIHLHTLTPQLLGDKKTSLVDKVSAHVHASALESLNLEGLDENFSSHVAWCSDQGVEAGLPNFHVMHGCCFQRF